MGPVIRLRCNNCGKAVGPVALDKVPSIIECDCGNKYLRSAGYIDTLSGDTSAVQLDHEPQWDFSADLEGEVVFGPWARVRKRAPRIVALLDAYAPRSSERAVLDIGLGTITARRIRRCYEDLTRVFSLYVGLDPSKEQCEERDGTESKPNMAFVRGIGERMPFDDRMFDAVLVFSTLDHCVAPKTVMAEVLRVLKPGGIVAILLNNNRSWFKRLLPRRAQMARQAAAREHNNFFSPQDVRNLLGNDFLVLEQLDLKYIPGEYTLHNRLVGLPYAALLWIMDTLGAIVLRERGGLFLTIARKAVL